MKRLNPWLALGLMTAILHTVLLFLVIPQVTNHVTVFYNQDRFVDGYDQLAENLVIGNGYRFYPDTARTTMREPGYPILLAGLMFLWGSSFVAVKVANLCLALATAWLMVRLGARMSSSRILRIGPPLLFLFHPATLIAESRGGVEILFTFLIVLFLLALYTAMEHGAWPYYAVTGAVLGLTVLVRSTPMLFPFFLLGYLLLFERQRIPVPIACRNIAITVAVMLAALSPWIIRNYLLTKRFVPTASVLGISAQAGEYICTHRSESAPWVLLDRHAALERGRLALELGYRYKVVQDGYYYQPFYSTVDELSFSRYLAGRVFGEYEKDPLLCAKCMGLNLFNFWFAGKSWMSTLINILVQLPYLVLALVGAVRCVRDKRFGVIGPMVLFILYVMSVHAPILAQARYSVPMIPLLSILASLGLAAMRGKAIKTAATFAVSDRECSQILTAKLIDCGLEKSN
jgi:4-amino-4-deoxy-L-arabinose transferase-like glycosyltransferase